MALSSVPHNGHIDSKLLFRHVRSCLRETAHDWGEYEDCKNRGYVYINLNRMNFIQDYDRSDCYDMCIRGQSQRVRVEVG